MIEQPDKSLQPKRDGAVSSASRFTVLCPVWLISGCWTSLQLLTKHRSLPIIVALLCSLSVASAETVRERLKSDSKFQLFAVIFGVTVDASSRIDSFRVAKVTDPRSHRTDPVDVKVPRKFVEAARKKLSAMKKYEPQFKDGKPVEFFTYVFYSPEYPDIVITDLDAPIDKQK